MRMKKILVGFMFGIIIFTSLALAVNLDFNIGVEDKIFFPNETIPINISIINRETTFSARNATLGVYIGKREYTFELGDIKAGDSLLKEIILPEFPPGDYIIKSQLNYTGFFDERTTLETYNSFHVRFPEMERLPRNIVIKSFSIPENITAGETYTISIRVSNEGNVAGDLIVRLSSLDVSTSKELHLEPGNSDTVNLNVKLYNPGVSIIEARVYAIVNSIKYLLVYDIATVFVRESNIAKLSLSKLELADEPDNKINQNDMVILKINILNNGTWLASKVNGILSSSIPEIEIIKSEGDFGIIPKNGFSNAIFEIKTSNAKIGSAELNLDVTYTDGLGEHSISIQIPITLSEGSEICRSNNDCQEDQICSNNRCVVISCECGEIVNHQCIKYDCCNDLDCEEGYICSNYSHVCEPSKEIKADVLIATSSKLKSNDDYNKALREYRETILKEGLTSFYILVDSQKVQELFNIQPANSSDWKSVKNVLDKIIYKVEPDYLLIIGGVDIIPQPPAKTESKIPTIPTSDDRYTDIDLDGIPDVSVGRIPDSKDNIIEPIIKGLDSSIKLRKIKIFNKVILGDICLFSPPLCPGISDVNLLSNAIFDKNCKNNEYCYPAPPYCIDLKCENKREFYNYLLNSDIINLNAHGSPFSFSALAADRKWYNVLNSEDLYKLQFNTNPILFTIACHGGTIDCEEYGCITKRGNVFSFLNNGVAVYIANTRYGYGGLTAKYLSNFYKNIRNGKSIGEAILSMKKEELQNSYTDFENAVIYEIQVYGDPTIRLIGV